MCVYERARVRVCVCVCVHQWGKDAWNAMCERKYPICMPSIEKKWCWNSVAVRRPHQPHARSPPTFISEEKNFPEKSRWPFLVKSKLYLNYLFGLFYLWWHCQWTYHHCCHFHHNCEGSKSWPIVLNAVQPNLMTKAKSCHLTAYLAGFMCS